MKNCKEYANQKNLEDVLKDWEMKLVYEASFKDGEISAQKEIAKGMLAEKLSLELIVKLTGLSLSEIEKLGIPLLNDEEK